LLFESFNSTEIRQNWLHKEPILQQIFKYEPSVIGDPLMNFDNTSTLLLISTISMTIYIPLIEIASFALYIFFIHQTYQMKSFMSASTYKSHSILFRAITVQIIASLVMLDIPFLIQYFLYLMEFENGSIWSIIFFFLTSYHLLCEILALAYFVKPYRDYIRRKVGRIFRLYGERQSFNSTLNSTETGNQIENTV
jgi:hypothetical protein